MKSYFEKVKSHFENGKWSKKQVRDAVGRWITKEEYGIITGEEFQEE